MYSILIRRPEFLVSLRLVRILGLFWDSIPRTSRHFETKANDFNHAENTHA